MNTPSGSSSKNRKTRRLSHALALLGVTAVALAASPTALAQEPGLPDAPCVQLPAQSGLLSVIRKLPLRFVSWSD
jgi:hypothetical protein